MRRYLTYFMLCLIPCLTACKATKGVSESKVVPVQDKMNFRHNSSVTLMSVVDLAVNENKLVFVDIYADWCTPCKLMDEDVFSDAEFTKYMKSKFVNYKVDGEKHNGPNLGVMYGVGGFPTLLILDQKGRILERHDGALYQTGLREMAERAIAKMPL